MVKMRRTKTEDNPSVDPSSRSFIYDEVDDFNAIDQDDSEDKDKYDNVAKAVSTKCKVQVLGLGLSISDEEDDDFRKDIQSSESDDDDASEEDYRSLGKRKRDYFGTDITDTRLHNLGKPKKRLKDEEALQIELKMAMEMQKRMAKYKEPYKLILEDEFQDKKLKEKETRLTNSQKSKKKQTQDPDFEKEVHQRNFETEFLLEPLMKCYTDNLLPLGEATEYLKTRYHLCRNFLDNARTKKMLEYSGEDVSKHPVKAKLVQFRKQFKELEPFDVKFRPKLYKMILDIRSGKCKKENKKLLGILKDKKQKSEENSPAQKKEISKRKRVADEDEMEDDPEYDNGEEAETDADGRRLISYEIAKNKGLMPSRKKEQRNPRVKYKKKYQNKLKRRKGQVREVRRELNRYGGESSGINMHVIKSIKFK